MIAVTEQSRHPVRSAMIVSYWYPPAVGAAAERIHAFARYLQENAWSCQVLTARHVGETPRDPGVRVVAVTDPWNKQGRTFAVYDPRKEPPPSAHREATLTEADDGLASLSACPRRTTIGQFVRRFAREFVFPDRFVRWQRSALQAGLRLAREHRPAVILASFPPAGAALLGLRLHEETGLPLVLDFRDAWFGPGGYEPRSRRQRQAHERLYRRVVQASAAIVAVSDNMADAIAAEHGCDRARVVVIPNGYDEAVQAMTLDNDSSTAAAPTGSTRLVIAHVGTVIARNRPDLFFRSVRQLLRDGRLPDVAFRFVGNLSKAYLDAAGLSPVVETTGLLPRSQAHAAMQQADALLLLTGAYVGRWGCNAKLFEYIRSGRPILCLEESPASNDRKLLEQFAAHRAFFGRIGDADSTAQAMETLRGYCRREDRTTAPPPPGFEAFSRRQLTRRLAAYLDTVVA